jgi:hypothetical protein
MSQNVRHIPKRDQPTPVRSHDHPEERQSFNRAQFSSSMVIVRFCAETSTEDEGEYIIRNLEQTVAFLRRRHGMIK